MLHVLGAAVLAILIAHLLFIDEDPADPLFQPEQASGAVTKPKHRRAKRSASERHPVRFPRPTKVAAPDVHPRPLHHLLPSSLKEAFDPTPSPALTSSLSDDVSMLDCMLDFDTDWSMILGPPHTKRAKHDESDFDDGSSWQTRSDAGCTSDLSDDLASEPSWLSPQVPIPSATLFKSTPSLDEVTPLATSAFTELAFDLQPTVQQPHDFGRCSPLCDAHASKVLLSLHTPKPGDLPPPPLPHDHSEHGVGCGHPIVKHNNHRDFLLPNGQVQCEEVGAVDLSELLDEIVFEEINGADWDIHQSLDELAPKLNLPPKGTAFSPLL
jgi:hypothetical protein